MKDLFTPEDFKLGGALGSVYGWEYIGEFN